MIVARKRFGQNFLHDQGIIRRIVQTVAPRPGEAVVEIGPGRAAITRPLLAACGQLDAVEIDRDLIALLRDPDTGLDGLTVHEADVLRFEFRPLARERKQSLRVVGNLPYNISTPLIFHLLDQIEVIQDMHFMLQREVVERMAAAPGGGDYGRLTVMLAAQVEVFPLFHIAPGCFTPAPQVESAFVRLVPHARPPFPLPDKALYARLVSAAFGQRRKTLRNALKGLAGEADIRAVGLDPTARAEQIAPPQYAALASHLLSLGAVIP
ncbi:16S rRNA (adenine(1518)-N(6)/adenine(1519)-N(6))-dimethyltransferase RsmA [Candidatus Macondimonas diazotrophica]|nr:16S rRNA (adenine(1518)-N(6)/adenine(1519)-N(6))-dimethyltransferase RsmA [Candidatus Macondimonas diazotrophica]